MALAQEKTHRQHGQMCPVWRTKAGLHSCDCWVVPMAQGKATTVLAATVDLVVTAERDRIVALLDSFEPATAGEARLRDYARRAVLDDVGAYDAAKASA